MLVDTHCHIDDEKFTDKDKIYNNIVENNLAFAINMGCNISSSVFGEILSKKYDRVYFGVGFHPSDINDYDLNLEEKLIDLSKNEKCVALGEIGLDFHFEPFDKNKQIKGFISQIELANFLKLPISIHSRDATEDMLNILKENKNKLSYGAVMHCFSGSQETAKELLKLGVYISFGGTLTFKNAKNVREVASFVPIEYCLTETDSPYLSPEPFRGQTNEPKNVYFVTKMLSEIKNLDFNVTSDIIEKNARTLFYKIK